MKRIILASIILITLIGVAGFIGYTIKQPSLKCDDVIQIPNTPKFANYRKGYTCEINLNTPKEIQKAIASTR